MPTMNAYTTRRDQRINRKKARVCDEHCWRACVIATRIIAEFANRINIEETVEKKITVVRDGVRYHDDNRCVLITIISRVFLWRSSGDRESINRRIRAQFT